MAVLWFLIRAGEYNFIDLLHMHIFKLPVLNNIL